MRGSRCFTPITLFSLLAGVAILLSAFIRGLNIRMVVPRLAELVVYRTTASSALDRPRCRQQTRRILMRPGIRVLLATIIVQLAVTTLAEARRKEPTDPISIEAMMAEFAELKTRLTEQQARIEQLEAALSERATNVKNAGNTAVNPPVGVETLEPAAQAPTPRVNLQDVAKKVD